MSKKKAHFYTLTPLTRNSFYACIDFYDGKERKMRSSVDVVLNLDYHDEFAIANFIRTR